MSSTDSSMNIADQDNAVREQYPEAGAPSGYAIADAVSVVSDPGSPQAEAVGALRTHMMAQHLSAGHRTLALCSPTPGIGCTSLAVNLAIALAEGGLKTLLIDADMRRPGVEALIAPTQPVPGLTQCLGSEATSFGDAIQPEVLPNLSILYAGGPAARPAELLSSLRFQQLVDLCAREFDIVIADTPPSNSAADCRRVASVFGYAMVVAGRNRTFVNDVKVLVEELQADNVTVIGSVLYEQ